MNLVISAIFSVCYAKGRITVVLKSRKATFINKYMITMRRFFFLMFVVFLNLKIEIAFSQTVYLRVIFPSNIDADKLSISYDNGKERKEIKPVIVNQEWVLKDSLYDPYSHIAFYYVNDPKAKIVKGCGFWLSDKPAEIIFHGDSLSGGGFLEHYTSLNVMSPKDDTPKEPIDIHISQAWADMDNYYMKNAREFNVNQLKRDTFECKRNAVIEKVLERIRIYPKDYFALDYFNSSVVSMRSAFTSNYLLSYFNEYFPDSLKNTYKGKLITEVLKSNISSKKGREAPDFNAKSINGDEVSLGTLKGKYVILDFWASWCAPCIKIAIPKLKEIRQKYSHDKLEIVSVTLDEDYDQYQNALKRLKTNFIDVFDGKQIVKDYAVAAIPQIILIHPNGTILYNREEENDADLTKLEGILKNILQ